MQRLEILTLSLQCVRQEYCAIAAQWRERRFEHRGLLLEQAKAVLQLPLSILHVGLARPQAYLSSSSRWMWVKRLKQAARAVRLYVTCNNLVHNVSNYLRDAAGLALAAGAAWSRDGDKAAAA